MEYWAEIVGQPDAVRILDAAAAVDATPSHAWLITGPPGSGRSNLAFRFAAALIARGEDREAVYSQVRARTHPDLGVLTTQKLLIDIKAARDIVTTAHYSPAEGRYRVIVIEDADRMPERTSNVLLKALEEPPERTIWILCAPSEADLLPTIRSRARSLRLVTPGAADIARLLHERDGMDTEIAERAARLAQSHIGMARRLASDPDALARRERTLDLALGVQTLGDGMRAAAALVKVAEADAAALTETLDQREREEALRSLGLPAGAAIPPQMRSQIRALEEDQKRRATRSLRDGIDRILTDLLSLFRDVLLTALHGEPALINREREASITDLAERWGAERALAVVTAVEVARERLGRGITPGLVLEALFATQSSADTLLLRGRENGVQR
ncbi:DNA polymerase III subunit delta' [Leucobacter sp. USCH14]|uniref:DNA polymerase III subunit delta' n=1 Tax=Leucobacter sp. USCH14 TaxID=3024838 RepID=UPI0030A25524